MFAVCEYVRRKTPEKRFNLDTLLSQEEINMN